LPQCEQNLPLAAWPHSEQYIDATYAEEGDWAVFGCHRPIRRRDLNTAAPPLLARDLTADANAGTQPVFC
jgi:hypothetical protein